MNFLAHFYLAFDSPDLLIGQFLGDYVKGKRYNDYPVEIKNGILLHRFIDYTTDHSPLNNDIKNLLRTSLGKYTGIALDVFYDHFLAAHWNTYHKVPLEDFILWVYEQLMIKSSYMNDEMKRILHYMRTYNWLGRYSEVSGIELTLREMSMRLPAPNTLNQAAAMLKSSYTEIEMAFFEFFPQLISDCKAKIDTFAPHQ